jgi:hypothetical protein
LHRGSEVPPFSTILGIRLPSSSSPLTLSISGTVLGRQASLNFEAPDRLLNTLLEEVVPEHHADWLAAREVPGEKERLGDATFPFLLVGYVYPVEADFSSIADEPHGISGGFASGDHEDVCITKAHQNSQRIGTHRLLLYTGRR